MQPMSLPEPSATLSLEEARARILSKSFRDIDDRASGASGAAGAAGAAGGDEGGAGGGGPGPLSCVLDERGLPVRRQPLSGVDGGVGTAAALIEEGIVAPRALAGAETAGFDLVRGGRITFEPGGQLEHSTAPHATAAEALADVEDLLARLSRAAGRQGAAIVALGCDPWSEVADVPLQLDHWRYRSMQSYFDRR